MAKVSIEIAEEDYKKIKELSDYFKQDEKKTISDVLKAAGRNAHSIFYNAQEKGFPTDLERSLGDIIMTNENTLPLLNGIPEKLGAKGLFVLEDVEVDLDKEYFDFHYAATVESKLAVTQFCLTFERGELERLTVYSYVDVEHVSEEVQSKLFELIESHEDEELFGDLEDFNIMFEDSDVIVDCFDTSIAYFPSIIEISRYVKKLFKKAGIPESSS